MAEKSVTKKTIITEVEHHHPRKAEHHAVHHPMHHAKPHETHHAEHHPTHHNTRPLHHAEHHASAKFEANKKVKKTGVVSNRLEMNLAQNIVELQKVHAHLAEKFDRLAGQMASLLSLFEGAAKTFTNNPAMKVNEKDREFLDKIDRLLEQNKIIAKGLTMMEERARSQVYSQAQGVQGVQGVNAPIESSMSQIESGESFRPGLGGRRPLPRF